MSGGVSPYSYTWSNSNTGDNITNLTAGFYQVQAEDNNGCLWIDHIVLDHPDSISLTINFAPDTCSRSVGFAEAITSGGVAPYDYLWDRGDDDALITDFSIGSYELSLLDANNCTRSKNIEILDLESPVAEFNIYPEQRKLYEQIDNPFSFVDYTNGFWQQVSLWQWDIFDSEGSLIESISGEDSVVEYSFNKTDTFTVLLSITTDYNCKDTISKKVIVNDFDIFIPNTFTPNPSRDNLNSTFKAYGFGIKRIKMQIFSKWGSLIYDEEFQNSSKYHIINENSDFGWDGKFQGSETFCPIGVYTYYIHIENVFGETREFQGLLNLIR